MSKTANKSGRSPARQSAPPLRFTRLVLDNWRNFQHLEVALARRLFVVGPNASGKSNFLDVFGFLQDLVAIGGGFQTAVVGRGGIRQLKCLFGQHHADIGILVEVGTDANPGLWRYELRFTQNGISLPQITRERVTRDGTVVKDRPDKQDNTDRFRLLQTYLEQSGINQEFRALADFFLSIQHVEIIPQLVRRRLFSIGPGKSFGATLLQELSQLEEAERERILEEISPVVAQAVPQLHGLRALYDHLEKQPHLEARFQDALGATHLEDQLSDGTLRLFGMLFTMLRGHGPLLVEEPDLFLHPAFVRLLPGIMARLQNRSGRQVLMTTHSPELLRDEGIALDEVLLLQPSANGARARLAQDFAEIKQLLEAGISLAESVPAKTSPAVSARIAAARE
jgi:predicted ATPase